MSSIHHQIPISPRVAYTVILMGIGASTAWGSYVDVDPPVTPRRTKAFGKTRGNEGAISWYRNSVEWTSMKV